MSDNFSMRPKDCQLLKACKLGSLSDVERLLEDGADIIYVEHKIPDDPYYIPLQVAINNDHTEVALHLINAGCRVDYDFECMGHLHGNPLFLAAQKDNLPVLKALLERGCDMNYMGKTDVEWYDLDKTALQIAIEAEADNCVYFLVEAGADTTVGCTRRSPLHIAIKHGTSNMDYFKAFVAAGCDVNATDYRYDTALCLACRLGNKDIAKFLIDNGANIDYHNPHGITPFMRASAHGHLEVVELLFNKGCNYLAKSFWGHEATHVTCLAGNLEVVKYLHRIGCTLDTPTKLVDECGQLPIDHDNCTEDLRLIGSIIWEWDDSADDGFFGETPLMFACAGGRIEVVKFLHSCGCDLNGEDDANRSCLFHVFSNLYNNDGSKTDDVVKYLVEQGVDINKPDHDGWSPTEIFLRLCKLPQDQNLLLFLFDNDARLDLRHRKLVSEFLIFYTGTIYYKGRDLAVQLTVTNNYFCRLPMTIQLYLYQHLFFLAIRDGYLEVGKLLAINREGLRLSELDLDAKYQSPLQKNKELISWLRELEENPFELKHLCRLAVRKYLQTPLRVKLMKLELPHCIVDFLMYNV